MHNTYTNNGVTIKPTQITKGEEATVLYNGLLYDSGADCVYMHSGYGCNWENVKDIQMTRTINGFEAQIPITSTNQLNLAFKDSANNWDNNSTCNYSFDVHSR